MTNNNFELNQTLKKLRQISLDCEETNTEQFIRVFVNNKDDVHEPSCQKDTTSASSFKLEDLLDKNLSCECLLETSIVPLAFLKKAQRLLQNLCLTSAYHTWLSLFNAWKNIERTKTKTYWYTGPIYSAEAEQIFDKLYHQNKKDIAKISQELYLANKTPLLRSLCVREFLKQHAHRISPKTNRWARQVFELIEIEKDKRFLNLTNELDRRLQFEKKVLIRSSNHTLHKFFVTSIARRVCQEHDLYLAQVPQLFLEGLKSEGGDFVPVDDLGYEQIRMMVFYNKTTRKDLFVSKKVAQKMQITKR